MVLTLCVCVCVSARLCEDLLLCSCRLSDGQMITSTVLCDSSVM